jgi:hypothetical protein
MEKSELISHYPNLIQADPVKYNFLVVGAKNIRIQLKNSFPGVKFSVKTDRFSGGDAIRISWNEGPTEDEVSKIVKPYQCGYFDGHSDCYEFVNSIWSDVFGGAQYITTHRN